MKPIGIVTPLPGELRTISDARIATGTWRRLDACTLVSLSGAGHDNARFSGDLLLANGATMLISWGCAAATSEDLRPGDLVLPSSLVTEDGTQYPTDPGWRQAVYRTTKSHCRRIHTGKILGADRLVASQIEKKALARKHQVIALDMESGALAKLARDRHVPFIAVRAIVDPADMDLPQSIDNAMNQEAHINYLTLFMSLLAHPGDIPGLIRLGNNFRRAQKTLKLVWRRAIVEMPKSKRDTASAEDIRKTSPTKNGLQQNHNKTQFADGH